MPFLFRFEHIGVCPNGAAILPALGNAQGSGGAAIVVSAQRANRSLGANRWPVGPEIFTPHLCTLGVALGWEIG